MILSVVLIENIKASLRRVYVCVCVKGMPACFLFSVGHISAEWHLPTPSLQLGRILVSCMDMWFSLPYIQDLCFMVKFYKNWPFAFVRKLCHKVEVMFGLIRQCSKIHQGIQTVSNFWSILTVIDITPKVSRLSAC